MDLEALDAYLMSDDSAEDCMMLSDLDWVLHGMTCSPFVVPPEEWMKKALGTPMDVPS